MTEMNVRWEVDNHEVLHELDRLHKGMSHRLTRELDFIMESAFEESQRIIHQPPRVTRTYVLTGSLKASGKVETSTKQRRSGGRFISGFDWEGSISYGGESHGHPHDPVDYAQYEQARGSDHDFMSPADATEVAIESAILDWYTEDDVV